MFSNGKLWLYSCSRPLGFPGSLAVYVTVMCVQYVFVRAFFCRVGKDACLCVGMCRFCALGRISSFFSLKSFQYSKFFFIYSTLDTYLSRNWVTVHFCWIIGDCLKWFKAQTPLLVWLLGTLLSFLICSLNNFSIIIFFLSLWTAGTTSLTLPLLCTRIE